MSIFTSMKCEHNVMYSQHCSKCAKDTPDQERLYSIARPHLGDKSTWNIANNSKGDK